ncbi:MAG: hypothetical protein ACRD8Z_28815 [Nitrososphaeraceae archaeon]
MSFSSSFCLTQKFYQYTADQLPKLNTCAAAVGEKNGGVCQGSSDSDCDSK